MILQFIPSDKMVEGQPYRDVNRSEIGQMLTVEARDVNLSTMDNGTIHVHVLPAKVIYHTQEVTAKTA